MMLNRHGEVSPPRLCWLAGARRAVLNSRLACRRECLIKQSRATGSNPAAKKRGSARGC